MEQERDLKNKFPGVGQYLKKISQRENPGNPQCF
jgi:hypothetical protein